MLTNNQSLNSRVVVVAGIVLAAFLSVAGWVLDQAFKDSALSAVRERLTSNVFLLLGSVDIGKNGDFTVAKEIPKPEWQVPESGHFAQIFDEQSNRLWHSRSMLGLDISSSLVAAPGNFEFQEVVSSTDEDLYLLSYTVLWETQDATKPLRLTVQTAEDESGFNDQLNRFRRSLWSWFAAISFGFLLVQTVILRWGLKPLRELAHEITEIEGGKKQELDRNYPVELNALAKNLNALIRSNTSNLQRYRNALGDLAHSLKTPLAVIKSTLDNDTTTSATNLTIDEQVEQLDKTINYQLQRAAAAGRPGIAKPVDVNSAVRKIASSLRKVYAAREITITDECRGSLKLSGDEGDLMEIIGNVADNACKWARSRVSLLAYLQVSKNGERLTSSQQLVIEVSDDGTGMPSSKVDEALKRGARLDSATEGHGIGLAVVRELCEEVYQGQLDIESSTSGTTVKIALNL